MFQKWILIAAVRLATFVAVHWASPLHQDGTTEAADPVTVVQTDPHHEGTLLAGTSTGLLFLSRNGAYSWARLPFPGELRSNLHAVLIDPRKADVYLIAVTSETSRYAGVFRSVDRGTSWEPIHDLSQKQVWALASWAPDGSVMAAGAQDGVYLTRDGGENWARIPSAESTGPQPVVALAFDPAHRNILYAGTPHLAWKTVDSGARWRPLRTGMQEDSDIFSIAIERGQPRRLFAGACSGIYRSLDGGNTWVSLERAVGAQYRTYVVAHRPQSANVLFAGTNAGLLQSPDGGATWHRLLSVPTHSIAFDPGDPQRVFIATDQGVLRSEDSGNHFTDANRGLRATTVAVERGHAASQDPPRS